jgi:hypothetical protein
MKNFEPEILSNPLTNRVGLRHAAARGEHLHPRPPTEYDFSVDHGLCV